MFYLNYIFKKVLCCTSLFLSLTILTSLESVSATPLNLYEQTQAIEGNIDDVARAILTYFPKVTGRITAVNGNQLQVDFVKRRGLSEGLLLTVFHKEEPFYHPTTGLELGRFETVVGEIEVSRFDPPHLVAIRVEGTHPIQIGDQVRLPATRIPIAISMSSDESPQFLMNELAAALSETGRFKIESLPPGTGFEDLSTKKSRYLIQLDSSRKEEHFSMALQIQNTVTGQFLAKLTVLIKQSEESDLILEHLQYRLFEQRREKE
ncbi:MAG: hypothetical protein ACE5FY_04150 [Nitrospiria bacterium]